MGEVWSAFVVALCLMAAVGCRTVQPTPAEVWESYRQLRAGLDPDLPGESIAKLDGFRKRYARYDVSDAALGEMARLRGRVDSAYQLARDLVRESQFDRAEQILNDVAVHFPDTDVGCLAGEFLQFEFHTVKAARLMTEGRLDEAEATLRALLAGTLAPEQLQQTQRMLDAIGQAQLARRMADTARAMSACWSLRLLLLQHYSEDGAYPASLSLADLDLGVPSAEGQIRAALSAIEEYQVSGGRFSFVAVGKNGQPRIRVTPDGAEQEASP